MSKKISPQKRVLKRVFIEDEDDEERFEYFFQNRKCFCTFERLITTKGKTLEVTKSDEETIHVIPSLADVGEDTSNVFSHEIINKLASYCEACESFCNGYGKNKVGVITRPVVAACVKFQHSETYFENLLQKLVEKRANHTDFVTLLRHRCIKLPLDVLAKKLSKNSLLFGNVLQYYLNGFGTDEFCQSPKEQKKAEQVVQAMLSCPTLDLEFDKSNGRLLLDAVLSPFTAAAKLVINDKRVAWSDYSATEIAHVMKELIVFEETRLYLLNFSKITKCLSETEQMRIETSPALEPNFQRLRKDV